MANDDLPLKLIFTRWYNSIRDWILDDVTQLISGTIVGGKLVGSKIGGKIPSSSIPNTAVTPGTYGDGTHVGQFTVEADGRLTFAQNVGFTPGFANPMTTEGDMIYEHSSAPTRLPIGAAKTALMSNGTDPIWQDPISNATYRWEPVCDVSGSVLVDIYGNPVMALASV